MKKKSKLLIVIGIIIASMLIALGIALDKFSSDSSKDNNIQESNQNSSKESEIENTIELTDEGGANPYFEVSNKIVAISKKAIPDVTKIDFAGQTKYLISLRELNEKYETDISDFNTKSMSCNIDLTGVLFIVKDDGIIRTSQVVCGTPAPSNEKTSE